MAQHILHNYSGTYPFPLVKKPRSDVAERRALRLRIWLARGLFAVLFAGVIALLSYEVRAARQAGWQGTWKTLM